MYMISIITVVFNSNKLLERTIKSIMSQTCKSFEYIVIDGGSTDGTLDIIKNYEKYIDFWCSSPDRGISDAFNKGIDKSSGDVIGILNAGDLFNVNTIEIVSNSFNNKEDYIYGNSVIRKEDGQIDRTITPINVKDFPYKGMPFQHSALFIKKRVYEQIGGFDLSYKTAMDFELLLRINNSDCIGSHVNQTLSTYYRGGVSDYNYIGGYVEVLRASSQYNNNYFKILSSFVFGVIRSYIRRVIG